MEAHQLVLKTLWLTAFVVPYLAFVVHNSFHRAWVIACRAAVAVLAGWLLLFSYALASDAILRRVATTAEQIDALNNGDGAKFAFALVLGWIPATLVVGLTWLIRSVFSKRHKGSSNNSLEGDACKATRASG
jgi:uncharacterized metal-binding protein